MSPGVIFDPFHLTKNRTNLKMVWLISVTHWPTRSEITISFINSAGYLDSDPWFFYSLSEVSQKWNKYQEILSITWILSGPVGQKFQNISKNSKNDSNDWFNRFSSWIFERTLSHAAFKWLEKMLFRLFWNQFYRSSNKGVYFP